MAHPTNRNSGQAMFARRNNANLLSRALDFIARFWRARTRRYRPERHYLRGKPSGLAARRRPEAGG